MDSLKGEEQRFPQRRLQRSLANSGFPLVRHEIHYSTAKQAGYLTPPSLTTVLTYIHTRSEREEGADRWPGWARVVRP